MGTKKEVEEQLAAARTELQKMKEMMGNLQVKVPPTHYKEKKFKKYDGSSDAEEWTSEILLYVNSRFDQNEAVKIDYIIDHLEGKAKQEIKYRLIRGTTNAADICNMLTETFSNDKTYTLQQDFFSRVQKDGESTQEYAYALTDLVVRMKHLKMDVEHDKILKERFANGVLDKNLRRELFRLNEDAPSIKFHELRKRALQWEETGREDDRKTSGKVKASFEEMTSSNLVKLLTDQQKQLQQMQQLMQTMIGGSQGPTTAQYKDQAKSVPSSTSSQKKPKIICRYCKEPNHVVKDCILIKEKEKQKQKHFRASNNEATAETPEKDSGNE